MRYQLTVAGINWFPANLTSDLPAQRDGVDGFLPRGTPVFLSPKHPTTYLLQHDDANATVEQWEGPSWVARPLIQMAPTNEIVDADPLTNPFLN